ncbi:MULTISPECIES: alpha-L-fucosidase [Aliiglaciecola]|uniref:alpha-L-fucosidase n=1 Tax=Aliiglaciecola TaxID=1406885 RepID=UPI001C098B0A|nr:MULTISPECIES: alpha-L-fucosidase [Aliiglaciecola]MBU2877943.1 alpha-L-fucosidase [Aliiglaciecola lipolytica]MDO6709308.1 alpha-L-fucosidase [Aliiglaciecola sp. 2_MG-2023]MDO6750456.1 alpha-L-fucosidase [Aliiglaciecola sp. 1_MG-2023]
MTIFNRVSTCITFISIVLLCNGCSSLAVNKSNPTRQDWVVIDINSASKFRDQSFLAKHKGKFVVQLVTNDTGEEALSKLNINGQNQSEVLTGKYKIESGSVYEFSSPVILEANNQYQLSLTTTLPVKQIRIVPHRSNPIGTGQYYNEWLTMHQSPEKQQALRWFKEARFGMFIHWGLYSQAGGMWKKNRIEDSPYPGPRVAEWLMSTFRIPRAEYQQLASTFNPDKSFAQNFAQLAKKAGMKYLVITSKHHDGFALYDSAVSDYDIVDATPYQGDLIKELYDACLSEGIEFGIYYSHGNDWFDGTDGNYANVKKQNDKLGIYTHAQGKNLWDPSLNTHAEYLNNKAYPQIKELLTLLPKLRLIWFDGDGLITEKQAFDFYKLAYDINPNVLVSRRVGYQFGDYLDAGDNVIPSASEKMNKQWETVGTTNNSWGFKFYDDDWKSTKELLYYFIDILSKGGNYLLNIGPDGQGNVPPESAQRLAEMGQWIQTNSAAIFGTTRWDTSYEGANETLLSGTGHRAKSGFNRQFTNQDFWFTAKQNKVYAMSLMPPQDSIEILSLGKGSGHIDAVRLLGSTQKLSWKQTDHALVIDARDWQKAENGFAVEIIFK